MPYNRKFYRTAHATAHCLAGTGEPTAYTASADSIISQRDADRKAADYAQAAAQSLLRCSVGPINTCPQTTTVSDTALSLEQECYFEAPSAGVITLSYTVAFNAAACFGAICLQSEEGMYISSTPVSSYSGEFTIPVSSAGMFYYSLAVGQAPCMGEGSPTSLTVTSQGVFVPN